MNVGDRVRTNRWWNERSESGPFRGELVEVVSRGTYPNAPLRTHRVRLDEPFRHYSNLTFDPRDLELESTAAAWESLVGNLNAARQFAADQTYALREIQNVAELLLIDMREDGVPDRHCRETTRIVRLASQITSDRGRGQDGDTSNS